MPTFSINAARATVHTARPDTNVMAADGAISPAVPTMAIAFPGSAATAFAMRGSSAAPAVRAMDIAPIQTTDASIPEVEPAFAFEQDADRTVNVRVESVVWASATAVNVVLPIRVISIARRVLFVLRASAMRKRRVLPIAIAPPVRFAAKERVRPTQPRLQRQPLPQNRSSRRTSGSCGAIRKFVYRAPTSTFVA